MAESYGSCALISCASGTRSVRCLFGHSPVWRETRTTQITHIQSVCFLFFPSLLHLHRHHLFLSFPRFYSYFLLCLPRPFILILISNLPFSPSCFPTSAFSSSFPQAPFLYASFLLVFRLSNQNSVSFFPPFPCPSYCSTFSFFPFLQLFSFSFLLSSFLHLPYSYSPLPSTVTASTPSVSSPSLPLLLILSLSNVSEERVDRTPPSYLVRISCPRAWYVYPDAFPIAEVANSKIKTSVPSCQLCDVAHYLNRMRVYLFFVVYWKRKINDMATAQNSLVCWTIFNRDT